MKGLARALLFVTFLVLTSMLVMSADAHLIGADALTFEDHPLEFTALITALAVSVFFYLHFRGKRKNSELAESVIRPSRFFYYGWIIVALVFLQRVWNTGLTYSMGTFFIPLRSEFGWSLGTVSLAPGLGLLVFALSQPVVGRLVDAFGSKKIIIIGSAAIGASFLLLSSLNSVYELYIFYSLLGGFGLGATAAVPLAVLITDWFKQRRGLALSIASSGIGFGAPIFVPLSNWLILASGWRYAFAVLGLATILILLPLMVLLIKEKPRNTDTSVQLEAAAASEDFGTPMAHALRTRPFWQLFIPYTICGFTVYLAGIHLIPLAAQHNISQVDAGNVVAWMGIAMTIGLVSAGPLTDKLRKKHILTSSYLIRGLALLLLLGRVDITTLYIFATIFGLVELATIPPTAILCREFYGAKSMGTVYGFIFFGHQLGGAISISLAGFIVDITESYFAVILLSFMLAMMAAVLSFTIKEHRALKTYQL